MNGRPLTIEWESDNIPSILETWHCGTMAGEAMQEYYLERKSLRKINHDFSKKRRANSIFYNKKSTGRPVPILDRFFILTILMFLTFRFILLDMD